MPEAWANNPLLVPLGHFADAALAIFAEHLDRFEESGLNYADLQSSLPPTDVKSAPKGWTAATFPAEVAVADQVAH